MASSAAQDKNLSVIRGLLKLEENKKCFDCPNKIPSHVNLNTSTFVCTRCCGLLRTFGFRLKSVSASTFTAQEIAGLETTGNAVAATIWLGTWSKDAFSDSVPTHDEGVLEFMRQKYIKKTWYIAPSKEQRERTANAVTVAEARVAGKSAKMLAAAPASASVAATVTLPSPAARLVPARKTSVDASAPREQAAWMAKQPNLMDDLSTPNDSRSDVSAAAALGSLSLTTGPMKPSTSSQPNSKSILGDLEGLEGFGTSSSISPGTSRPSSVAGIPPAASQTSPSSKTSFSEIAGLFTPPFTQASAAGVAITPAKPFPLSGLSFTPLEPQSTTSTNSKAASSLFSSNSLQSVPGPADPYAAFRELDAQTQLTSIGLPPPSSAPSPFAGMTTVVGGMVGVPSMSSGSLQVAASDDPYDALRGLDTTTAMLAPGSFTYKSAGTTAPRMKESIAGAPPASVNGSFANFSALSATTPSPLKTVSKASSSDNLFQDLDFLGGFK
ncbi:hypothetical protein DFJ73DRAFT_845856 [Zopfochytrium polystomum]|nr:hypothetical protein DFJ73DRAFT_845856 [Zopfochytrium polystomum]